MLTGIAQGFVGIALVVAISTVWNVGSPAGSIDVVVSDEGWRQNGRQFVSGRRA